MTTKAKTKSKKSAVESEASAALAALAGGRTVTIAGETYDLPEYADMPRKTRRQLRNALMKMAPEGESITGKSDFYLAAYEAGVIAVRAAGAVFDPEDESLPEHEADALDQAIAIIGIRMFGEMNRGGDDEPKNAVVEPQPEVEPSA